MQWKRFVWVCTALALQGFGVEAFQSCVVPSTIAGKSAQRRAGGGRTPGWVRVPIEPLAMSMDDESTTTKRSKRTRFKEGVKKVISYPKKIRMKFNKIRKKDGGAEHVVNGHTAPIDVVANGEHNAHAINGGSTSLSNHSVSREINGEVNSGATAIATPPPIGETQSTALRSATTNSVDLSGKWELVVSEDFKTSYDDYLKHLGQPSLVRSVALSIIGMTTEETVQSEEGRELKIRGHNLRGNWERTLKASSEDKPIVMPIVTADNETVQSECWWEENGSIHRSWLRGVDKYGGGNFESKRYLEEDGKILVCESTFHPDDPSREKASVVWKFRKADETN